MVKKIILLAIFITLFASWSNAQERKPFVFDGKEQVQVDEKLEQLTENLVTDWKEMVGEKDTVKQNNEAVDMLKDFMSLAIAVDDVCSEENKNSAKLTTEQAKKIIKAVAENNVDDFNFRIIDSNEPISHFGTFAAVGKFNENETQVSIFIVKNYCLMMAKDMGDIFQKNANEYNEANKTELQQNEQDLEAFGWNPTVEIAGDKVRTDKLKVLTSFNFDAVKGIDDEKQNAYAFAVIGNIEVQVKAHRGDYAEVVEKILRNIKINELYQVIGHETTSEIKKRLYIKTEERLKNNKQISDQINASTNNRKQKNE